MVENGRCQSGRCWAKTADIGVNAADVSMKIADANKIAGTCCSFGHFWQFSGYFDIVQFQPRRRKVPTGRKLP